MAAPRVRAHERGAGGAMVVVVAVLDPRRRRPNHRRRRHAPPCHRARLLPRISDVRAELLAAMLATAAADET